MQHPDTVIVSAPRTEIPQSAAPSAGATTSAQKADARPFFRYLLVTAIATPANIGTFALLLFVIGLPVLLANLIAATVVSIPTYLASREWVWQVETQTSASEAAQYWTMTVCSVAAASLALAILDDSGMSEQVLVVTPLGVYTVLWFLRFLVLDKYLFKPVPTS